MNNLQLNADKPGVVEYETDIGDSGESLYYIKSTIIEMSMS